jgi:SAM-dependent methyltransferase
VLHPLEGRVSCGVDIDADALAAGRARWPGLGLAVARGEELPFADGAFDLVCLRVSLPYMRVQDAMRECGRVLTPGGEVWLALHGWRGAVRDLAAAVRRRSVRATAFRAYVLANGLVLQATGSTVAFPVGRRPTESWQGARGSVALTRAGFADVEVARRPEAGSPRRRSAASAASLIVVRRALGLRPCDVDCRRGLHDSMAASTARRAPAAAQPRPE